MEKRGPFIDRISADLAGLVPGAELSCFTTPFAAFFVVAHPDHKSKLGSAAQTIPPHWRSRFIDERQIAMTDNARSERQ